jgi:hypothetical protein
MRQERSTEQSPFLRLSVDDLAPLPDHQQHFYRGTEIHGKTLASKWFARELFPLADRGSKSGLPSRALAVSVDPPAGAVHA